jgi:hypothetical protein
VPVAAPPPKPPPPTKKPDLTPKLPDAPDTVPRAQVERALKDFLEEVRQSQGGPKVRASPKVHTAGRTLSEDLDDARQNIDSFLLNNKGEFEPGDLAKRIADLLPDHIPGKNYRNFLKLKTTDTSGQKPKTLTEKLSEKVREEIRDFAGTLPKSIQGPAEKLITTAIEKGSVALADKGIAQLTGDSKIQNAVHKFVDEYVKKLTKEPDKDKK